MLDPLLGRADLNADNEHGMGKAHERSSSALFLSRYCLVKSFNPRMTMALMAQNKLGGCFVSLVFLPIQIQIENTPIGIIRRPILEQPCPYLKFTKVPTMVYKTFISSGLRMINATVVFIHILRTLLN